MLVRKTHFESLQNAGIGGAVEFSFAIGGDVI